MNNSVYIILYLKQITMFFVLSLTLTSDISGCILGGRGGGGELGSAGGCSISCGGGGRDGGCIRAGGGGRGGRASGVGSRAAISSNRNVDTGVLGSPGRKQQKLASTTLSEN